MDFVEYVISLISEKFGKNREEILREIEEKEKEFAGLISKEGAAKLVAREYGISVDEFTKFIPLSELVGGMKNVSVKGRVFRVYPPKEFKRKDGSVGRIATVIIGDGTGFGRLIFWDKQASVVESNEINAGDVIKVYSCNTRENVFGGIDLVVSKYSSIKIDDNEEDLPTVDELERQFSNRRIHERIPIAEARLGMFEFSGTIVHVYRGKYIFYSCPICFSSVSENDGKYVCDVHGEVIPIKSLVISVELDDNTGTMRIVFFRENAKKLIDIDENQVESLINDDKIYNELKNKLLGRMITVRGRVKINKLFGRLEMIANEIEDLNLQNEIEQLIKDIEVKS